MKFTMDEARAEWRRAFGSFDAMRTEAEASVALWRFTEGPVDIHPHATLARKPPRELSGPIGDHCARGFDDTGRIRIQRDVSRDGSRVSQQFWRYDGDVQIGVAYGDFLPPMPRAVTFRRWDGARLIEEFHWWISPGPGLAGWSADAVAARIRVPDLASTTWVWQGDRVVSMRRETSGPSGLARGTGRWSYDDAGVLAATFTHDGHPEQLVWERPGPETVADVHAAAIAEFLRCVPPLVPDGAPIYAVALCYRYPDMAPQGIAVGRVDRRGSPTALNQRDAEWIAGMDEIIDLWRDDGLRVALERAVSRARGDTDEMRALLIAASRALLERGAWQATRTDGFVVLPVDFELEDLAKTAAAVSPEALARIQRNRWLLYER